MPSFTARSNTPQRDRKETHRRRRSCAKPCSLATRASVFSRRSTGRGFIRCHLVSVGRSWKGLCRSADNLSKLRRLGTVEQAIAKRFRNGLPSDLRSLCCRKDIHDGTADRCDWNPLMLANLVLSKVILMDRYPFGTFTAEPYRLRHGEMHTRRIQVRY